MPSRARSLLCGGGGGGGVLLRFYEDRSIGHLRRLLAYRRDETWCRCTRVSVGGVIFFLFAARLIERTVWRWRLFFEGKAVF